MVFAGVMLVRGVKNWQRMAAERRKEPSPRKSLACCRFQEMQVLKGEKHLVCVRSKPLPFPSLPAPKVNLDKTP